MNEILKNETEKFIIKAKQSTYVGGGKQSLSYRPSSHDLQFHQDNFSYLDSYFGGQDFIGQEIVYYNNNPIWAMNYYGYILKPDIISPDETGNMIKESLAKLYTENRFLGGFEHESNGKKYFDTNKGTFISFSGKEWITKEGNIVYELLYHGGLIKD